MAKPDLENGYLRLAHELFAAFCCAGFGPWESIVMREIFDTIYGAHKNGTAFLSPSDIARRYGTSKQVIRRAIDSLVRSNVLIKIGFMEYRFNKDYETWMRDGKPMLSPKQIAVCKAANRRQNGQNVSASAYAEEGVEDGQNVSASAYGVSASAYEASAPALTNSASPLRTPIADPARKKRSKKGRQKKKELTCLTEPCPSCAGASAQETPPAPFPNSPREDTRTHANGPPGDFVYRPDGTIDFRASIEVRKRTSGQGSDK